MTPTPTTAEAAGADKHRDEDDEEETAQASVPGDVEPGERGGDGGGGGGGDDPPAAGGSSATTSRGLGIDAKTIAIAGAVGVGAYLLWRWYQNQQAQTLPTRDEDGGGDSGGGDPSQSGGPPSPREQVEPQEQNNEVNITAPDDDPLQADHQAGQVVFGWGED